ncbi:(d)CMP kinase [Candidatus Puniceispirillum sp.]|nr:(d)CMP kinase [Candidatus Puniceispirillum sp.]
MIIAIDGSAASGKGTLARKLALRLNYDYLDTGALYRAVALSLMKAGIDVNYIDENQAVKCASEMDLTLTKSPEIRTDLVASLASNIASLATVRAELLTLQRAFAAAPPSGNGAVLDGRDIGTIILPDADLKFFIDANISIRADRRTKELLRGGQSAIFRDVLAAMKIRDYRDRTRLVAPLRAAEDAISIDTSNIDADALLALALSYFETKHRVE